MRQEELEKRNVIEELEELGIYNNDGLSLKELSYKLAIAQVRQINVESNAEQYF